MSILEIVLLSYIALMYFINFCILLNWFIKVTEGLSLKDFISFGFIKSVLIMIILTLVFTPYCALFGFYYIFTNKERESETNE
jgi:hypothetical protein